MRISLIVFLGNKGSRYRETRHNVAWLFWEDMIASGETLNEKFHGLHGSAALHSSRVRVLLPHTYMNESGRSVSAMMKYFSIPPEEVLIVHDDIELPFGKVTLQRGGGTAGHNGLKSIFREGMGKQLLRLRIGVGRPAKGDVASFVLSRFAADEEPLLHDIFLQGNLLLKQFLEAEEGREILPLSFMLM